MPPSDQKQPVLYHAPLACSLAVRFAAAEMGMLLDVREVNLGTGRLADGADYRDIHPLGQVSAMDLPSGDRLTETSACLLWVQGQASGSGLDADFFQIARWIGFCATELHKQIFRTVFYPEATDEVKDRIRGLAPARLAYLDAHLDDRHFLVGDNFTAADAYLAWCLTLTDRADVPTDAFVQLNAYRDRLLGRPRIAKTLADDRA